MAVALRNAISVSAKVGRTEVTKKVISPANNLLASGAITQEEYNQLVQSDCKYRDEAKLTDSDVFDASDSITGRKRATSAESLFCVDA